MKITTCKTHFQPRYLLGKDENGEWQVASIDTDDTLFDSFREALEIGETFVEENGLDPNRLHIAILNVSAIYPNL